MPKPWYTIKAAADDSSPAEVFILEPISAWYGVDAKSYLEAFRGIKASKVKVYINSPGGDVMQGLAIFNGMRASGKEIEVHVLGIAASIASYIAMAGDKVVMPANTLMLLHNPMTGVFGNADELRDAADMLEKVQNVVTATYAKRWKGEEKALLDMLAAETLLTAAECLEHGFCDEVTDEIEATASFDVDALPPAARKVFEAAASRSAPPAPPAVPESIIDQVKALVTAADLEAMLPYVVTDPAADTLDGARAVVARMKDVRALAMHAGVPEHVEPLIRGRKTLAEARAAIATVLAERDANTRVDTAVPSTAVQRPSKAKEFNPTQLWAEIEAVKAGSTTK